MNSTSGTTTLTISRKRTQAWSMARIVSGGRGPVGPRLPLGTYRDIKGPRLRRGASNAWGCGGHVGAPSVAHPVTEDRDGFAGAVPRAWGSGGHVGAPSSTSAPAPD